MRAWISSASSTPLIRCKTDSSSPSSMPAATTLTPAVGVPHSGALRVCPTYPTRLCCGLPPALAKKPTTGRAATVCSPNTYCGHWIALDSKWRMFSSKCPVPSWPPPKTNPNRSTLIQRGRPWWIFISPRPNPNPPQPTRRRSNWVFGTISKTAKTRKTFKPICSNFPKGYMPGWRVTI